MAHHSNVFPVDVLIKLETVTVLKRRFESLKHSRCAFVLHVTLAFSPFGLAFALCTQALGLRLRILPFLKQTGSKAVNSVRRSGHLALFTFNEILRP